MDVYLKTTFIGEEGAHGYVKDDQYEIQVEISNQGWIKIYEPPDENGAWQFDSLYSFLQNWTYVSLIE